MSCHIKWIDNDVHISCDDEVTFAEMAKVTDAIYADPKFSKMNYQLWDFSKVERNNITHAETSVIAELDKRTSVWNDHVKVAVVSTNMNFRELILTYMKILEDTSWSVRAFRNVPDAKKWCTG